MPGHPIGASPPTTAKMNLLQTVARLRRYRLVAVDGEIGRVEDYFFDDATWIVRYLVTNTGNWLGSNYVLISPIAIGEVDEEQGAIYIELTRQQLEQSPPVNLGKPLSRQYERRYFHYYNWIPYWESNSVPDFPGPGAPMIGNLRNISVVDGYSIGARDGTIGHVDGFVIDTLYWAVRYLEIDTRNWWPGKHVLINPAWIEHVNWKQRTVTVDLTREAIKSAPAFEPSKAISRDYETRLFKYYGRSAYWHPGRG
jgi:hypothetical protein